MSEEKKSSGCLKKGCFISCFGCLGITVLVFIVTFVSIRSFIGNPVIIPEKILLTENCEGYVNLKITKDNKAGKKLISKLLDNVKKESKGVKYSLSISNIEAFLPLSVDMALYPHENKLNPIFCLRLNKIGYISKFVGLLMKWGVNKEKNKKEYSQYKIGKWESVFEWKDSSNKNKNIAFLDNNIIITYSRADMEWAVSEIDKKIKTDKTKKIKETNTKINSIIKEFPSEAIGKGTILNNDPERFMTIINYFTKNKDTQEVDIQPVLEHIKKVKRVDLKVLPETDEFFIILDFISEDSNIKNILESFFEEVNKSKKNKNKNVQLFKTEIRDDRITVTTIIKIDDFNKKNNSIKKNNLE